MARSDDDTSVSRASGAPDTVEASGHRLARQQFIAGRYEVLAPLGSGHAGTVYRVRDHALFEDIALKVLRPELFKDPRAVRRFRKEVRLARKIAHPNVCRVFDAGESDGLAFLTMELLPGETLRSRIAAGVLSLSERLQLFEQTARGLAAVHAEGVLHRDLKPENVLLRKDGNAVVSDFGFAIMPDDTRSFISFTGMPLYTSPEQLRCELPDSRSDVFALGIMGHELLTGTHPFGGGPPALIMSAILRDAPASLEMSDAPESLTVDLAALLQGAMAKDRAGRPSAAVVADTLAGLRKSIAAETFPADATRPLVRLKAPLQRQRALRRSRLKTMAPVLGGSVVAVLGILSISSAPDPASTSLAPSKPHTFASVAPTVQRFTMPTGLEPLSPPLALSNPGTVVPADQRIDKYFPIWKRLFTVKNSMSVAEFERRITSIVPSVTLTTDSNLFLRLSYTVVTDWARVELDDKIVIALSTSSSHSSSQVFLEEQEIAMLLSKGVGSIHRVPSGARLKYATLNDAIASLSATSTLCSNFEDIHILFPLEPHRRLQMLAICKNNCGHSKVDLESGEMEFVPKPCVSRLPRAAVP
jgi:serine/threonine-protein kinase